jgi:prepilin-type N-terminal cleavage/methylation domain-containing protein
MREALVRTRRTGFSLLEVVIAVALGAIVIGTGMLMYVQGTKYFYKTTEHSSFRTEALVILERVAEDLDQIQVSTEKNPSTNRFYLVQPYELLEPFTLPLKDQAGNVIENVPAGYGLRFYRFHHIEMGAPKEGVPNGVPKMVARRIEYRLKPIEGDGEKNGFDLERNDKKVNKQPLKTVIFHMEPMIVAANQVQGSRHAILTVTVVPKGGVFGNMDYNTVRRLQEEGTIVSRTFHLIGYESFYTSVLYSALQTQQGNGGSLTGVDELQQAVLADAQTNAPGNLLTNLQATVGTQAPPTHLVPGEAFVVEPHQAFDDATASSDPSWLAAPETPGRPAGAGEFSFEDNGAGPGSGSGSGSGSASSASGSGSGSG